MRFGCCPTLSRKLADGSGSWHAEKSFGKKRNLISTACDRQGSPLDRSYAWIIGLERLERIQFMADKERKKSGLFQVFKDIVYGMSSHEMTRHAVRSRAS